MLYRKFLAFSVFGRSFLSRETGRCKGHLSITGDADENVSTGKVRLEDFS